MKSTELKFKTKVHFLLFASRRGVALIMVLCFLVLISALILAFYLSISAENISSKSGAVGSNTKQLADSTVQFVMGMIRQSTSLGTNYAWASQPGMIRTFDNTGSPYKYFKLYSAYEMITTPPAGTYDPSTDVDPQWDTKTALYTDLNSPVSDSSNNLVFPIVDPTAYQQNINEDAEGFSYSNQTPTGTTVDNVVVAPGGSTTQPSQRLPMPVVWLYQLRDGTLISPDVSSTTTATFNNATSKPTTTNPIVARVAFWTDDETCKVNINTACGDILQPSPQNDELQPNGGTTQSANNDWWQYGPGSFWDTPRCSTWFEHDQLAEYQPVQNEFQRFPGHPAQVYLASVFPGLIPTNPSAEQITGARQNLLSIVPRVGTPANASSLASTPPLKDNDGGTDGGTALPLAVNNNLLGVGESEQFFALVPDSDRLYASVDELLFAAPENQTGNNRVTNINYVSNTGATSTAANNFLSKSEVERKKFFITAHSRAPELNLFGQPRIAMWPIDQEYDLQTKNQRVTAFDMLIAFCSHLGPIPGGQDYFFRRLGQDPGRTPGASGYDSPTNDSNYANNKSIFSYLQRLTSAQIPGFGGSFSAKYPVANNGVSERDQIIAEILDYIRCTNLYDDAIACSTANGYLYTYTPGYTNAIPYPIGHIWDPGHGFVAPMQWNPSPGTSCPMGFGRFETISEVGLHLICNADGSAGPGIPLPNTTDIDVDTADDFKRESNLYSSVTNPTPTAGTVNRMLPQALGLSERCIQAEILLDPFCVSEGYTLMAPNFQVQIQGLDGLTVTDSTNVPKGLGFPADKPNAPTVPGSNASSSGNEVGGSALMTCFVTQGSSADHTAPQQQQQQMYPLIMLGGAGSNKFMTNCSYMPARTTVGSTQVAAPADNGDIPGPATQANPNSHFMVASGTDYPFVGAPMVVNAYSQTGAGFQNLSLNAANGAGNITPCKILVYYGTDSVNPSNRLIQTINVDMTQLNSTSAPTLPIPTLFCGPQGQGMIGGSPVESMWSFSYDGVFNNATRPQNNGYPNSQGQIVYNTHGVGGRLQYSYGGNGLDLIQPFDVVRSMVAGYPNVTASNTYMGDYRLLAAQSNIVKSASVLPWKPYPLGDPNLPDSQTVPTPTLAHNFGTCDGTFPILGYDAYSTLTGLQDTGRLVVTANRPSLALYQSSSSYFQGKNPHTLYVNTTQWGANTNYAANNYSIPGYGSKNWDLGTHGWVKIATPPLANYNDALKPEETGDFDNGLSYLPDGSFINKPDEGNQYDLDTSTPISYCDRYPYFDCDWQLDLNAAYVNNVSIGESYPAFSSPNRLISSPGVLGSLSTGVQRGRAWETLLFRPPMVVTHNLTVLTHPNAGVLSSAYNYTTPPDHLIMDLFWMPVVQPYAISDQLSTAGKINLNYQIVPFTYIKRATAMTALLHSEMMMAIPTADSYRYKYRYVDWNFGPVGLGWPNWGNNGVPGPHNPQSQFALNYRYFLNVSDNGGTLTQFNTRFKNGDIFRSPTEICDIYLVPDQHAADASNGGLPIGNWTGWSPTDWRAAPSSATTFWSRNTLTGDNSREGSYARLYAHLTTKSNTFTVHMRVQTLQKVPAPGGTSADQWAAEWVEGTDQVVGEYRGSSLIERYFEGNDQNIPNFLSGGSAASLTLDTSYKFRVISNKKFAP